MNEVQAHINNLAFPKTLDEVEWFLDENGHFNIEDILIESQMEDGYVEWTVPKWCKAGDIVFFMHSVTSKSTISRLSTELKCTKQDYSCDRYHKIWNGLLHGKELYQQYGGKIFAVGMVEGAPFHDDYFDNNQQDIHWKSKIYAKIINLYCFTVPIDIDEFHDFIMVSRQSAITPVFGKEFEQLKQIIIQKNTVPNYLQESTSTPIPLSTINSDNWLNISSEYRRSFFLEIQFRTYFVDYFLRYLGDNKTFFRECPCIKNYGSPRFFADNVIKLRGKYLPVETKLNVDTERDFLTQLLQYCMTDYIILKENKIAYPEAIYNQTVLAIDTFHVYLFDSKTCTLKQIAVLDEIKNISDISILKTRLIGLLSI